MRNTRLSIHIPAPPARPGEAPDFSRVPLAVGDAVRRPPIDAPAGALRSYADGLIRVLDDSGAAAGAWLPDLTEAELLTGLRAMMRTRAFDDAMFRAQRQGKISLYAKCRGEEAVGVAQALALDPADACFPHYRTQGFLIARGYALAKMMAQVYSNSADPLKGRQLPTMYSARECNYVTQSANLATQVSQAVGWAMAAGISGDTRIACTFIGEGATAEGDFHHALTFASVYRAPVIINVVNNQWAISSFQGVAGGENATFAARGIGYGIPALRVDGNDFLAVYAASVWAADRARLNLGPTLIEHVTYRAESHSTSDDPTRYRPNDEAAAWPLGDPIARLKRHLIHRGAWSEETHSELQTELTNEIRELQREAEKIGTLATGDKPPLLTMFEDIFKKPDWRLMRQAREAEKSLTAICARKLGSE